MCVCKNSGAIVAMMDDFEEFEMTTKCLTTL